jgi:hypothetical protein
LSADLISGDARSISSRFFSAIFIFAIPRPIYRADPAPKAGAGANLTGAEAHGSARRRGANHNAHFGFGAIAAESCQHDKISA